MRSATAPELATLARLEKVVTVRLKVANGSGTLIDLTSWLESWSVDHDIDQPVGGATFSFSRAHGTTQSLAPLREDSVLNVDDTAAYAPLLDLNRIVTFEVATTNIGAVVLATDYKMLFKGTIDVVNFEKSPVSIECRDLGAPLVDRWIEAEAFYGTTPVGTDIEDVMQEILDDVFGAGAYTLYTPASPSFLIVKYSQQVMSTMDALQDLAQLIGWDIRYKWDSGTSAFRLTLSEPDRTKTVPDHTFSSSTYIDISRLNLDLTNIRNAITITFREGALGNRSTVTVTDSGSITKYNRRVLIIQEPDVSPINTNAEATVMATAALDDLKEPKAEQEVEMPFFWPTELGDLYRYSPNDVHYDVDQDLAVAELRHSGSRNSHRTNIKVGGSPRGQYLTWIGRGGSGGPGSGGNQAFPPVLYIVPLNTEIDETYWDLRFYASYGTGGGGANLTYTVSTKARFATEQTISSGNASAFPLDLAIMRDIQLDTLIIFRATDVATGMQVQEMSAIPMYNSHLNPTTGNVVPGTVEAGALPSGVTDSAANPLNDAFFISANTVDDVADGTTFKKVTGVVSSLITPNSSTGRNRCLLTNTTNQSLTTTTNTIITWDSETFDVGGLHSTSTNTGRITIPTGGDTGLWLFIALLTFDSNGTGARSVEIRRSDGVPMAVALIPPVASGPTTAIQVVAVDSAPAAGTWYEARGYQSSGGNLNVIAAVSFFAAHHLW